jgi:hypothetical protein
MNRIIAVLFLFALFFRPCYASINGVVQAATRAEAGVISSVIAAQLGANAILSRQTAVSAASANAAMIRRMMNPYGAALLLAAIALGYYLSDGELFQSGQGTVPDGTGLCRGMGSLTVVNTLPQCLAIVKAYPEIKTASASKLDGCGYRLDYEYKEPQGFTGHFDNFWVMSGPQCQQDQNQPGQVVTLPSPLTEEQKTAFRESQTAMSPQELLSDETGVADRQVPEIQVQLDDMEDDYKKATDTNPDGTPDNSTQPDTDPTIGDDGIDSIHPGEIPVMPSKADQLNKQQKTDCDKYPNSIGCSLYGDPATPDTIQQIDLPIQLDVGGTWGNTSCPSPIPLPLAFGSTQFSLQPMCDFMLGVRPIVFALSWLMAGFIVMSSVRD